MIYRIDVTVLTSSFFLREKSWQKSAVLLVSAFTITNSTLWNRGSKAVLFSFTISAKDKRTKRESRYRNTPGDPQPVQRFLIRIAFSVLQVSVFKLPCRCI